MATATEELEVIGRCVDALRSLDREECERVLQYLRDRFVDHRPGGLQDDARSSSPAGERPMTAEELAVKRFKEGSCG